MKREQTDDWVDRVGQRIRQVRLDARMSQTALARELGVADSQVSRWERGRVMPSRRYLEAIGRVFDVPAETFLLPGVNHDGDDEAA